MRIENKILHRDCCSRGIAIVGGQVKGQRGARGGGGNGGVAMVHSEKKSSISCLNLVFSVSKLRQAWKIQNGRTKYYFRARIFKTQNTRFKNLSVLNLVWIILKSCSIIVCGRVVVINANTTQRTCQHRLWPHPHPHFQPHPPQNPHPSPPGW